MNQRVRSLLALVFAFALGQLHAVAQTSDDPAAGTWHFADRFSGSFTIASPELLFETETTGTGVVEDFAYGLAIVGGYTISGRSVTVTLDQYSDYEAVYTGTLDTSGYVMTGTVTLTPVVSGGVLTSHSGSFRATKDGAPPPASLIYEQSDFSFQVGSVVTALFGERFRLFKYRISGSLDISKFPYPDPENPVFPDTTSLSVTLLKDNIDYHYNGGSVAEDITGEHIFDIDYFNADPFFDAATPPTKLKPYRTNSPSLVSIWHFKGPHGKPPTRLKFVIVGLGRDWFQANGNPGGLGGVFGAFLGLGDNTGRVATTIQAAIAFSPPNGFEGVTTGTFDISGNVKRTARTQPLANRKTLKYQSVSVGLRGHTIVPKP